MTTRPNMLTARLRQRASPTIFSIDEFGGGFSPTGGSGPQTITDAINHSVDLTKV